MKLGGIVATAAVGFVAYKTLSSKTLKRYIIGFAITKGADILRNRLLK